MANSFNSDSFTTTSFTAETIVVTAGVQIEGIHAVPLVGRRAELLIPVEFMFRLKSELIVQVVYRFKLLSTLIREIYSNIKLKSPLLIETFNSLKLKSSLLVECIHEKIKLQSTLLTKYNVHSYSPGIEKKKLKEVLLRKLKEMVDDDDQ